jgi:TPR repeat protein
VVGDALVTGTIVKADPAAAAGWYEHAALQGHAGATQALTTLRVAEGAGSDEMARLFKHWLVGAKRGDAMAQRVVGDFYLKGVGVERSTTEAQRWLAAAADQGNTAAMVLLGGVILQNPVSEDLYPEAVELFRRASAQGNVDAEYNLGVCWRRGWGVVADDTTAEQHYRAAAERNHVSAQLALADLLAARAANEVEWTEATRWYRMAADSGNDAARARLAELQETRQESRRSLAG